MPPYISIGGYSDPPRLAYLSVEVDKGEMVVITGPPGSGKSNLIKSMAGIRGYAKGSIKILGSRAGTLRSREGAVFVFQNWNFLPDLTVRNQLERKVALHRGFPTRDVRRAVARWCQDLDLGDAADRYPGQLNRSELQLLALCPAALVAPPVLVLDEPMANLSSIMVSSAMETVLSVLENGAILALSQARSPLVSRADRMVNLA
jgi:ABC-type multidrug transport system ATPase subunit